MKIAKDKLIQELEDLNFAPLFEGSQHWVVYGQIIDIEYIKTLGGLIKEVFDAGQRKKIEDIKKVLNIADPR